MDINKIMDAAQAAGISLSLQNFGVGNMGVTLTVSTDFFEVLDVNVEECATMTEALILCLIKSWEQYTQICKDEAASEDEVAALTR